MAFPLLSRWRASRDVNHQLDALLALADANAPLALRNVWLMELGYWLRHKTASSVGSPSAFSEHTRLRFLLQVLDRNPVQAERFGSMLRSILKDNDARSLFADTGMAARPALLGELISRVQAKCLPVAPNQAELSVAFALLFVSERDAEWVSALDETLVARLVQHVTANHAATAPPMPELAAALADSIVLLCNQIAAAALEAPIRLRLDNARENARVLMKLSPLAHDLIATESTSSARLQLLNQLHATLACARSAIDSVYEHLERYGVSVDVVFQVERTRLRIERVEDLLAVWADNRSLAAYLALTSQLITANLNRRSVRALLGETYSLLGRKVVERSAETGEHYIARTRKDYFGMVKMAAGGGALTAGTVYLKFFLSALHLNKFIEGVFFSLNYAGSFLAIHFSHFTLATKQPAMTAPALAQKLDDVGSPEGRTAFVDETIALIRSQAAAIVGNLALVFPVALMIQLAATKVFDYDLISAEKAQASIESVSLLGPTAFFAAFTGILLWLSSLTAGWADNWFALHRLHDGLAYHRRLNWVLGAARTTRIANFAKAHVAGVVANTSLGIMLGLIPTLLAFVGLPIEVRHVTLSTGSVAAAIGVLGIATLKTAALWWAVGGIAAMAVLNLAVSFALAFSMALQSHGLRTSERRSLRRDVLLRLLRHPLQALLPPKS
ncbi:MAG: recombinase [Casimicrobium sp.]|jgi:site-specific recombinase